VSEKLAYTKIKADGGTQMRAGLNSEIVRDYADIMRQNNSYEPFPAIIVYFDGRHYWLGDGFHRHSAAWYAFGATCTIPADVRAGTRRDAILHAAGANNTHGLPRTNADKRRAVEALLRDEEWGKWSDREIARRCAVTQPFVSSVRKELTDNGYQMPAERTVERNGQTYAMNTEKIGQSELSTKIHKLEGWLLRKGWGMSSGPAPTPSGVHKGRMSFQWEKDNEKAHFSALKNAEHCQLAEQMAAKAQQETQGGQPVTRTLDAALPAIQPAQPPADPLANDSRIIEMDKLAAEIRERRPTPPVDRPRPVTPRPLTDNEVEAVIWRGITHHARIPDRATSQQQAAAQLAWLQSATVGDFGKMLNPGISFAEEQLARIKTAIETELSKSATPPTEELDSNEWYSPAYILVPGRKVLGNIDLDPASCEIANTVVNATAYYDKTVDGLALPWRGKIWLNPPYSDPYPWIKKLFTEYEMGNVTAALVLLNTANSPQWAQLLWSSTQGSVCMFNSRIRFWRPDRPEGKAGDRDQMLWYIGPTTQPNSHARFRREFEGFGSFR
jgi:hypothetical protein